MSTTTVSDDALGIIGDAKKKKPAKRKKRSRWGMRGEIAILSGPAIIIFVFFVIVPIFVAAYYGFFKYNGSGGVTQFPNKFLGLQNYKTMFADSEFRSALLHTAFVVVVSLIIQGPLAIILSLLLNRKMHGRGIIRVLIFFPYVISPVIAAMGWNLMLSSNGVQTGAINGMLKAIFHFKGSGVDWLGNPHVALWTLMAVITWQYIGFAVILFLAGMQSIPDELSEAAAIDGASYWQIQRRITLPLLSPTIRIWALLSILGSIQLFDVVNVLWGTTLMQNSGVETVAMYMYNSGPVSQRWGFGNAVSVVIFLISLIIALLYQRFILRRDTQGALTESAE